MPTRAQMVFCTCPDRASAEDIARHLVESRLAACVNLLPGVDSIYRWLDQVEQSEEVMLLIKTRTDRLAAVESAISALHPYEVPEILAIQVAGGSKAYLDWLTAAAS